MLHIKAICNMTNKAFDMMIDLIKGALPDGETLPQSYREATRWTRDLGTGYELIHACKNDCVLFWKEHADKDKCPKCNTSRWSIVKGSGKKIPQKVLWYFPIKLRLQRLFTSKDIAKQMRWHKDGQKDDATLSNTRPIPLCGKSLIRNMTGLLVIPTTCDLVWQVMVSTHLVI
jgi:hypothetical protein